MVKNYFKLMVAILFVSNVMAQNVPSYVPKNGLVGWWPFNGNANDESGKGNHGTVNGATLTEDRNGKANSAYSFDGISNFIDVTEESKIHTSNSFTVSTWFNSNKIEQKSIIGTFSNYSNGWRFNIRNNGELWFELGTWGSAYAPKFKFYKSSNWYNVICVKKLDSYKLFVNGILVDEVNSNNYNNDFNLKLKFGVSGNVNLEYFNGKIDDIAIFDRALSDQEIKQLYEGCTKETATSNSFNSVVYTTNTPVNLSANPTGGAFSGEAVTNNTFEPSKAKLGKNQVKYNFKNSTGCTDSTNFNMILVDTLGNKCSTYDTILKINFKLTTGIKAGQLTSMNVYPNPASELLIIEANDIQALSGYRYKIVDLQGKEVYNALATTAKTEISLKSIGVKGMYILHIVDEKGVSIENKKIVLE